LGVSVATADRYIKNKGFPAAPLPDGTIVTSVFLIDSWLMARGRRYEELKHGKHEVGTSNQD
jgi:hypothetical protein